MKKFLFNNMFDTEAIEKQQIEEMARLEAERIAEENAPPIYSLEELEEAKAIAYQQGMQEGKAEAMASIEQQAGLTLELVSRKINDLLGEYQNWTAEIHHDSISMSTTIMRKLAPELLRGTELPQVQHIINEAFQFLTDQPKVMIRVASDLEPFLNGKLNLLASRVGYEGQVLLVGDPELELTDCRISWHAGAVERTLDETWTQIDEMVDRVLRSLPARNNRGSKPCRANGTKLEEEIPSEEAEPKQISAEEQLHDGLADAQPPEGLSKSDSETGNAAIINIGADAPQTVINTVATEGEAQGIGENLVAAPLNRA